MSQTQTVDPMCEAFYAWWTSAACPIELGQREREFNCWKAGAAWAAKTPAESAVIEAAKHWANSCRSIGLSVKTRANGAQSLLDAVAAMEREKVEGASSEVCAP